MARIKTYYTTDETLNGLYTFGGEYMTLDRKEYKGPYHRYTTTNEIYTESKWDIRLSKRLVQFIPEETVITTYRSLKNIQTANQVPVSSPVIINKEIIDQGFVLRYFIKKINDPTVIEINQSQYTDWLNQKIDRTMYTAVSLTWYITGEIPDIVKNGVTTKGVQTKNRESIAAVVDIMPELISYLTNLTELYVDSTFYIPTDINLLDS
jgi:hypothetical protein